MCTIIVTNLEPIHPANQMRSWGRGEHWIRIIPYVGHKGTVYPRKSLFIANKNVMRLFDLQDSLDKLMHFLPQLSDFVPLKNGFYSFRAQTNITVLTRIATL